MDRWEYLLREKSNPEELVKRANKVLGFSVFLPESLEELFDRFPETFKPQMNISRGWAEKVGLKIW